MIDKLPGDPWFPPGCSNRDIDRAFGDRWECEDCGCDTEHGEYLCRQCERERMAEHAAEIRRERDEE